MPPPLLPLPSFPRPSSTNRVSSAKFRKHTWDTGNSWPSFDQICTRQVWVSVRGTSRKAGQHVGDISRGNFRRRAGVRLNYSTRRVSNPFAVSHIAKFIWVAKPANSLLQTKFILFCYYSFCNFKLWSYIRCERFKMARLAAMVELRYVTTSTVIWF